MKDKPQLFKAQTATNFQQFAQLKTTKQISLKKQHIDQLKKALKSTQGSHSTNQMTVSNAKPVEKRTVDVLEQNMSKTKGTFNSMFMKKQEQPGMFQQDKFMTHERLKVLSSEVEVGN